MSNSYLIPLQRPEHAVVNFVLFPHAGSHANFFWRWRQHLPPDAAVFAVQLAGRMNRSQLPYDEDFAITTRHIAEAVEKQTHGPVHFYGHSLGGLLAFGTALQIQRRRLCPLRSLSISGTAAPPKQKYRGFRTMNDREVTDCILAYGGIPDELLADTELLNFFLPTVRADLRLLDDFNRLRDWVGQRVSVPLYAYCGRDDKVANRELMADWRLFTDGHFSLDDFPGSHFFISEFTAELCQRLIAASRVGRGEAAIAA